MKRALSLIIVLAMVLCMIPFSAFAADFDVATDFVDGVITLVGSEEQTFLWTATEDGTLEIFAEAVVPEVAEGEEVPALAEPYILVDGAEYTEAVAVTAGQSIEITIGDNAMIGGDVTVYTVFKGLPGTETNPYEMYNPSTGMGDGNTTTVEVAAGDSVYYNLYYYAGMDVTFTGNGVKISALGETIDGTEAGYVTMTFGAGDRMVLVKFTNKSDAVATYEVSAVVPVGTSNNPEVITEAGEYTAELEAGNQGYYYLYTAEGDGTVTVTIAAEGTVSVTDSESGEVTETPIGWTYVVNNLTTYAYGDTQWSDSDPVVNPAVVEVSAGDQLMIMVGTYNAADAWNAPAGTVTTTIAFEAAEEGPIVIESLPYAVEHTGNHEQVYSYTATEAGYLYVTTSDGIDGGFVNFNVYDGVKPYGDGYVLYMNVGDSVEVTLGSYWSADDAVFSYNFSLVSEIEPDGSEAFPFVIDTLINTTETLTNDGEDAVYYTYTAEKNGEIYNSFWESASEVVAGETMSIYVPAGQSVTVYYLPAVAMIGEIEYTSFEKALDAAVSGDTIVLVADAVAEGAYHLPIGVNLDLGANTLTIGGLAAFAGSAITGDLGNAVIVTEYLIANIVEIDGVEYAWTASDAGYILDVYTAPVVGEEEEIVAEYNGEQMGLAAAITAAGAVATADAPATVTLISDATVTYNVVIEPNVILNIGAYTLTAPNVIGLSGSMINAAHGAELTAHGKIVVPTKDNMALSDTVHVGSKTSSYLLPVWNEDHYLFTQVRKRSDEISYPDEATVLIKQRWYWDDAAVKTLLSDGVVDDNGLKVIVKASWIYGGSLNVEQKYYISGSDLTKAVSGSTYGGTCDLTGLTDYTIQGQIVSDCGAVVYWTLHNVTTPTAE